MPWSSGIFQRIHNWVADRNGGVKILAAKMDGEFENYRAGMNDIVNGTQPFTGTVKVPFGTAPAPGLQFNGDNDTGLARTAADTMALVTGGVARFTANTTALTSTLPLSLPVGSAATPAANWNANDGFFSPSAGVMALSLGGVERLRWTATGQSGSALQAVTWPNQFKIKNGDFSVNQRGQSSYTVSGDVGPDLWRLAMSGGGSNFPRTTNTSAIGHLVPKYYWSMITTGHAGANDAGSILQRIESAASYSGQNITLFGWSKRATAGNVAVSVVQSFGTGGSPSATVQTYIGQIALTTSWSGWKLLCPIPSIAGKTLGTNGDDYLQITIWTSAGSTYNAATGSLGLFNTTVDFYGIHERVGDVPIEAINYYQPPDPQVELARCQRYFGVYENCMRVSTAAPLTGQMTLPVTMRAVPSISNVTYSSGGGAAFLASKTSIIQTIATLPSANAAITGLWADAEL